MSTVPYEKLDEENASQNTAGQGTGQKGSKYKILIGIACAFCLIAIIAIMVIIARIFITRKTNKGTAHPMNTTHFVLIYATNITDNSSFTVDKSSDLNTNLMKALDLEGISIDSAQFVKSSGDSAVKTRQASQENNDQCKTDLGATGDRFIISFTIEYPQECNSALCQQKTITNVENHIKSLHRNINLPIKFTNGQAIDAQMSFCSLTQTLGKTCGSGCSNNGTCSSLGICKCSSGWAGIDCTIPVCSSGCLNGGTCITPNVCKCTQQWNGSTCAIPICSPPCLNNGICASPDNCSCQSGWSGATCAKPICSTPCSHGGTCIGPNVCDCPADWNGEGCTKRVCSPRCEHGGTCRDDNVCICPSDYTGAYCETALKSGTCFYGQDKVNLINGGQRSIENLKVGDRIWSISSDGNSFIEDEVVLMMHNGLNQTALFYTFKTVEGYEVSLTSAHTIPVFVPEENEIKFTRASKVTLEHRLIMFGRKVEIETISINSRQGFYSPLTLTGYLFVNNISTSVFSDSYQVSPDTLQRVFMPIRIYYRLIRWCFGNNYNPFETNMKQGLHPIAAFLKQHEFKVRSIYYASKYILPTVFIAFILHFIPKFSYWNTKKDY